MDVAEEEGQKAVVKYLTQGGDVESHWAAGQLSREILEYYRMSLINAKAHWVNAQMPCFFVCRY